ncbi:MAG: amidohydrolase family protein [Melioribacteraceae bacterium]|nr:amidohydrolase family protein [Melioribacteraceae bacterium]
MNEIITGLSYKDSIPISISIKDGIIDSLKKNETLEESDLFIAPGFIDIQVNGYINKSFNSPGLTVNEVNEATRALWKTGVTTYFPTLITNPQKTLVDNFKVLALASNEPETGLSIPGFHLEGPYISPVDGYRGAHSLEDVRSPNWDEFLELKNAADDKILLVTIAPEVDGAESFIKNCVQENIVVSLGHHNGTTEQIKKAATLGAKLSTHLGNGCANSINRFKNPIWQQLSDERLIASIIVDGFHLPKEVVDVFYKTKGYKNIILVSDMTELAGMPPGKYNWLGKEVVLTAEGLLTFPEQNVFAGASLPLSTGIENMMSYTGCSLAEAVDMASKNPAQLHGLSDRGEIEPGKRADLVLFRMEENKIIIEKTILAGKTIYQNVDS